ncbi:pentapeptide repeat-containing protein [Nonomuraea sp. NPDC002799]
MILRQRSPQPPARPPDLRPPRSMWWWVLPAAALIGVAAWGTTAWLLQDLDKLPSVAEQVSTRIEAARTALAAAAGVGAAVTLMLAVRRQRHQELATAHTTHDATERRVTELYTKAVEQLGDDQAPVRLGGLYALERLAQDTPGLRQTIVDVICSYLRMPYTPPLDQTPAAGPAVPRAAIAGVAAPGAGRDPHEELQVRLTAQRILAAHLRYNPPPPRRWSTTLLFVRRFLRLDLRYNPPLPRRWWPPRRAAPQPRHWTDTRLDLTGAALVDFDLSHCHIGDARFDGATFTGNARFDEATFAGNAWFTGATFNGGAEFEATTFTGDVVFNKTTFTGLTRFVRVTFTGEEWLFDDTVFTGDAWFSEANFTGFARFGRATFSSFARFDEVTFTDFAWFGEATFTGFARFDKATFTGNARFDEAIFNSSAKLFDGATFAGNARFDEASLFGGATFNGATFCGGAQFEGAAGMEIADLRGVQVAPVAAMSERRWPPGWREEPGKHGWRTVCQVSELAAKEGQDGASAEPGG